MSGATSSYALACDGTDLAVSRHEGTTPHLVFLHGLGLGRAVWESTIANLDPNVSGLTIDLRGHGDSGPHPEGDYPMSLFVDDLRCAVDAFLPRGSPFHLIGHSFGAQVAITAASENLPGLVSLVLVDGAVGFRPEVTAAVRAAASVTTFVTLDRFVDHLHSAFPFASHSEIVRLADRWAAPAPGGGLLAKLDARVVERRLADRPEEPSPRSLLQRRTHPVLLVRGKASAFLSEAQGRDLVRLGLVDRLVEVERAGHNVMLDNPIGLARVLQEEIIRCD